ncbi:MAG: glycosyltransferase family 4 protein, partial [Planctomycetota bacterium]|nr:glycosyltransferase family 4 protein [Planctomycetota bacterium]
PYRRVAVRSDDALNDAPVVSLWGIELGYRIATGVAGRHAALRRIYNDRFDRALRRHLGGGDVLHVANTYGWHSMHAAKQRGMRVVLDQQSAHPDYLRMCREHVYPLHGLRPPPTDEVRESRIRDEIANADLILVPSRFVLDENLRRGIEPERLRFVPIGVDTTLFRPGPAPAPAAPNGPLRVLFAGTASVLKGAVTLLRAAERFGDRRIELTFAGAVRDEMRPFLEACAAPIRLTGPVTQQHLAGLFREADLLCLPSYVEGSALVVYEAMACGLTCVVTRQAGSVVRDGADGLIVSAGAPEELAETFAKLHTWPEWRAELGVAARNRALDFDVLDYGQRLLAAYDLLDLPQRALSTQGAGEPAAEAPRVQ